MKKEKKIIIVLLCITLSNCSYNKKLYDNDINKIEIVSLNWSAMSRSSIECDDLYNFKVSKSVDKYEITEKKDIFEISTLIKNIDTIRHEFDVQSIDSRIAVKLHYKDVVKFICFGNVDDMQFEGKFYRIDNKLFKKIISHLSQDHQEIILEYRKSE